MVTVIGSGVSISRTFWYNENKTKQGVAKCIQAANYPLDLEDTDANMRLNMLLKTAALNPDVKRSSIHISMNFAPGELLSDSKLINIAAEYMQQIGFGEQPYLVYRHYDAAHPHVHIATVKIRPDGTRIDTQNIGRKRSEPARKALENKYGLIRAEDQKGQLLSLVSVNAAKVIYGESPTRKAIATVLKNVLPRYKYTSLHELNALLNQYNIAADMGGEKSRINQHQGLVYHVLDADGKPVGVPIKASAIYNNPGRKYLEKQYLSNSTQRQPHKLRIKNAVDLALLRNPKIDLEGLMALLKKEGIHVAVRQNSDGYIYGLTYVDYRTQCVFNGSAIGKEYSAKAMLGKLQPGAVKAARQKPIDTKIHPDQQNSARIPRYTQPSDVPEHKYEKGLFETLMETENTFQIIPNQWKRKKKRKKKR